MSTFCSLSTVAYRRWLPKTSMPSLCDLTADCELQSGNSRRAEVQASPAEALRQTGADRRQAHVPQGSSVMNSTSTPAEVAMEDDRRFFESHPALNFRLRPARDGELQGLKTPEIGWVFVVVRQLSPGVRVRVGGVCAELPADSEELAAQIFAAVSPDVAKRDA